MSLCELCACRCICHFFKNCSKTFCYLMRVGEPITTRFLPRISPGRALPLTKMAFASVGGRPDQDKEGGPTGRNRKRALGGAWGTVGAGTRKRRGSGHEAGPGRSGPAAAGAVRGSCRGAHQPGPGLGRSTHRLHLLPAPLLPLYRVLRPEAEPQPGG